MVCLHRILIPTRLNDKIWSNYLCNCLNHSTMEIRLCCNNDGISHMHILIVSVVSRFCFLKLQLNLEHNNKKLLLIITL